MRYTKVRLDGWCECGLGQQRNDDGGCAKDQKALRGTFVTECVSRGHFGLALSDHPLVLRWLSPGEGWDTIT